MGIEMDTGTASVEEARTIHKVLSKHRREFPFAVHKFEVRYGEDSAGAPAVWILFFTADDPDLSDDDASRVNRIIRIVKDDLFKAGVRRWPYIRFRKSD
jgi:hypothetical protein